MKKLISVFAAIDNEKEMDTFFHEIFTESEINDLNLRWQLMGRLHQGDSQRKIASELGVSLCKITRGAKILKNKQSISKKVLKQFD